VEPLVIAGEQFIAISFLVLGQYLVKREINRVCMPPKKKKPKVVAKSESGKSRADLRANGAEHIDGDLLAMLERFLRSGRLNAILQKHGFTKQAQGSSEVFQESSRPSEKAPIEGWTAVKKKKDQRQSEKVKSTSTLEAEGWNVPVLNKIGDLTLSTKGIVVATKAETKQMIEEVKTAEPVGILCPVKCSPNAEEVCVPFQTSDGKTILQARICTNWDPPKCQ
jgi:hypothetical protein